MRTPRSTRYDVQQFKGSVDERARKSRRAIEVYQDTRPPRQEAGSAESKPYDRNYIYSSVRLDSVVGVAVIGGGMTNGG